MAAVKEGRTNVFSSGSWHWDPLLRLTAGGQAEQSDASRFYMFTQLCTQALAGFGTLLQEGRACGSPGNVLRAGSPGAGASLGHGWVWAKGSVSFMEADNLP